MSVFFGAEISGRKSGEGIKHWINTAADAEWRREGNTVEDGHGNFNEYYEKYEVHVTRTLGKITGGNTELMKDLGQEVWIAFYKEMDEVAEKGADGIRAWLYVVARHKYIDHISKAYYGREVMDMELMHVIETAEEIEDSTITRLMFEEYMAGLSREERILILCRVGGIPPREALPELECSDGALQVRTTRAIKKLRAYMRR